MNAAKPPVDFLFIGPSKTGSTWIFELLRSHPDVFVPRAKDLQFFDRFYDKGWDWYVSYFAAADGRIAGEVSHDYILHTNPAIERIREHLPRAKLICCLRDPYERAASGANFRRRHGKLTGKESIIELAQRNPEIIVGGQHHRNLERLYRHFPKGQVLVLLFDDLRRNPRAIAARIFDFLGVSFQDSPVIGRVVNPSQEARHRLVARYNKRLAEKVRRLGYPGAVGILKRSPLVTRLLYRRNVRDGHCLTEREVDFLRPRFNPDIQALARDYGIECLHWQR